jgi:hypothetical protein
MHDDIITQTTALFNSNTDHLQQAIDRSGKTNIVLAVPNAPGPGRLSSVKVSSNGIYMQFEKPENGAVSK